MRIADLRNAIPHCAFWYDDFFVFCEPFCHQSNRPVLAVGIDRFGEIFKGRIFPFHSAFWSAGGFCFQSRLLVLVVGVYPVSYRSYGENQCFGDFLLRLSFVDQKKSSESSFVWFILRCLDLRFYVRGDNLSRKPEEFSFLFW